MSKYFLTLAYKLAQESPDPSTQNGAIIVSPEGSIISQGCNTFPDGAVHLQERLERPQKYMFIEHAERNAVFAAARRGIPLIGSTMYCPWFACADCARAIIQSGIRNVVGHYLMMDKTPSHWGDSISAAFTMFKEAGIYTQISSEHIEGISILMNGDLLQT